MLWQAYEELEPASFDDWKHDVRFARLMALIAQVNGNKNVTMKDFLPDELKKTETPYQKGMRIKQALRVRQAAAADALERRTERAKKRADKQARKEDVTQ